MFLNVYDITFKIKYHLKLIVIEQILWRQCGSFIEWKYFKTKFNYELVYYNKLEEWWINTHFRILSNKRYQNAIYRVWFKKYSNRNISPLKRYQISSPTNK
jgi:hypothetical protein